VRGLGSDRLAAIINHKPLIPTFSQDRRRFAEDKLTKGEFERQFPFGLPLFPLFTPKFT
jgi:hypothetical protein